MRSQLPASSDRYVKKALFKTKGSDIFEDADASAPPVFGVLFELTFVICEYLTKKKSR